MKKIVNTIQIFEKAMQGNDFSFDIYFRMAVIDNYLNKNIEEVWRLYYKMQQRRCKLIKEVPLEMINHREDFINLINNFKIKGYDYNYPILINKDGLIIDGAHRMACSIYFDVPYVSIYTSENFYNFIPAEYTKKWFVENELYDCVLLAEIQKEKVGRKWDV